jgi:single-strand DNA-binding protein
MAGYNKIVLVGNLTRDPEMRVISSGSGVTKFALAVNRRTKQGDETMFIDIVAWERLGEICNQYLKKGALVLIEGRLSIRSYEDKDGVKRKAIEVVATDMQMLGTKNAPGGVTGEYANGNGASAGAASGSYAGNVRGSSTSGGLAPGGSEAEEPIDDEIPF